MLKLRMPNKDKHAWLRTCQACGHMSDYKNVDSYKGDSWMDTKCKKCKSADLDRGTMNEYWEDEE